MFRVHFRVHYSVTYRYFGWSCDPEFNPNASPISYGEIRAKLSKAGKVIGPHDLQIAAIGLCQEAILVTHNTREFSRVEGLVVDDWELEKRS